MSISWKIIAPVCVLGLVLSGIAIRIEYATFAPRFSTQGLERAQTLARTVAAAAANITQPSDLQRMVAGLQQERDVQFVAVVGGQPARVLATTNPSDQGVRMDALPGGIRDRIDESLRTRAAAARQDDATETLTLAIPIAQSGTQAATPPAAVVVVMDESPLSSVVSDLVWRGILRKLFLILSVALVALIAVRKFILRPIAGISTAVDRQRAGDAGARAPIAGHDEMGRLAAIINDAADARADSEQKLAEALERVELAVRGSNAGLWDWRVGSGEVYYSLHFKELLGEDDTTMPNTVEALRSRVHPDDLPLREVALQAHLDGHGPFDVIVRARHRDGTLRWFRERGEVVRNAHGTAVRIAGVFADVTARVRLEAELRAAKDRAEQAVQAKSAFLATMSHEIRTPMNGVLGMAELLLSSPLSGDQRDCAETIRRSGDALLRIIDDILDVSKIEAGRLSLEATRFDIESAVDDVVDLLAEKARGRNVRIVPILGRDVPQWATGDPGRVRQILINLVGNAIKFTENGDISIRVQVVDRSDQAMMMRFDVRDSGIGIPEAVLPHLFEPFVQGDTSTTRRFGGTGLGLTISKHLAEQMGGAIGVESTPGHGSLFWFTIRFGAPEPGVEAQDPLRGVTALVVADHEPTRAALEARLIRLGAAVRSVASIVALAGDTPLHDVAVVDECPTAFAIMRRLSGATHPPAIVLFRHRPALQGDGGAAESRPPESFAMLTGFRSSQLARAIAPVGLRESETPAPGCDAAVQPDKTSCRILVVEDNLTNQKVAVKMLENLGYSADVVANGQLGLDAHAAMPYDLILMDCQMPVMDGYQATLAIRGLDRGRADVPIIAVTANALDGDREKCFAVGMNDFLPKPLKRDRLREAVEQWLHAPAPSLATANLRRPSGS